MTFSLTLHDWFVLLCLMLIANLAIDALRAVFRWVYYRLTRKRRSARFIAGFERRLAVNEARQVGRKTPSAGH